jgi:putative acyl-CoA dehydrogenase
VKYWVCKSAPAFVYEAMECLGGNGYVEESPLPRLYREAPVNAIWEGSGNVMCLDVLRAMAHDAGAAQHLLDDLKAETAGLPGCDDAVADLRSALADPRAEPRARALVERLALLAAAAALKDSAPATACEAFARTRLVGRIGATYGSQPFGEADQVQVIERALPPG